MNFESLKFFESPAFFLSDKQLNIEEVAINEYYNEQNIDQLLVFENEQKREKEDEQKREQNLEKLFEELEQIKKEQETIIKKEQETKVKKEDEIEKIYVKTINFKKILSKKRQEKWMDNLKILEKYKKHYKKLPTSCNSHYKKTNIYAWMKREQRKIQNGKMSMQNQQKFNKILNL